MSALDGPCDQCKTKYPAWWTDHEIWNSVMGGPGATDDPGGLLCPTCFLQRAGVARSAWKIAPTDSWAGEVGARGVMRHAISRAEAAEASVARARALADEWEEMDDAKPYAMTHIADCADDLYAALDGERP